MTSMNRCPLAAVCISVSALLLCAGSALAATINVPADQPTIQVAINAAVNGDEIVVAPGIYNEQINFGGKAITVRSSGGPAVTTITGSTLPPPVVAFVSGETSASILDGFTITGGAGGRGAGMRIGNGTTTASSPIIRNVIFSGNSADSATSTFRRGGAVSIQGPSTVGGESRPRFENVTFTGNSAGSTTRTSSRGGAVDVAAGFPTFFTCTFTGNSALGSTSASVSGGAIHIELGGATIQNSTFTSNQSIGSTTGASGGAIQSNGSLTIENSTFTSNTASGDAGAIAQNNGSTTMTGGAIRNNSGGGGSAFRALTGSANFTGVEFSGNTSTTNTIVQMNNPATGTAGPFTFNNCTFVTTTSQFAVRMAAVGSEVIFNGGSFTNATGNGNAVFASDPTSTLRVTGTTFQGYGTATTAAGNGIINSATYTGNGTAARFGSGVNNAAIHTLASTTFTGNGTGVTLASGTLTVTGTTIDATGFIGNRIGISTSGGTLLTTGLTVQGTSRGAINLNETVATINGGQLSGNVGFGSSGILSASGGTVTVNGLTITANTGTAFSSSDSVFTINNSQITNNSGSVTASISATTEAVTISGCTFRSNTTVSDTLALTLDPSLSALITGNTFELNDASSAITIADGTPVIRANRFLSNTNDAGSGTINIAGGSPILDANLLLGNALGAGSVIYSTGPTSNPVLVNNVIARNAATSSAINIIDGGAILANNTIVLNTGSALQVDTAGTVSVANSILRGNAGSVVNNTGIVSVDSTNIEGGWTGTGTGNIDQPQAFVDADGADNAINTADDNFRLPAGSIGINAGSATLIPAGITLDAAGLARVSGGLVDHGAYELQGSAGCNRADIAGANQSVGPDNQLTADDIIVFLSWYFASDTRADFAGPNQSTTPDGQFTADDIIVFLGVYFAGC